MKRMTIVLIMLLSSFNVQAYSNFIENPYTPYPPGCATLTDMQVALYGGNSVKAFEGEIKLASPSDPRANLPVNLAIYRVACADENRSIIVFEFAIPDALDPATTLLPCARGGRWVGG